ncbi:MAG: NnrS family protein [Deltaproteobacteria bacterium]|nr:NnrS family protein [Deltaproteobacteria bacterium]
MMPVLSAPPAPVAWRREPFRLFFPVAVVLGAIGVGHWLFYATGITTTYSGFLHGQVMTQAFMMALAVGFLMTAVPRRTQSAPPAALEMACALAALVIVTAAALAGRWALAQLAYAALFLVLLQFAVRRFLGHGAARRPPASFVLVPIAVAHGLAGALLIALATRPGTSPVVLALGRLFVEQGVFLCLAVGVGSLVLPLMAGEPPPADLGSSPRERAKLAAYALLGAALCASMVVEAAGWVRLGPLCRAAVVVGGLVLGGGAARLPKKPGLHRRLVWLAVWLMPVGLVGAALAPDLRIAMLHVLFIGGFSLMGFGVATHVSLNHLDLERLALGRPPAVVALGLCMVLAMLARVGADFSEGYFDHLAWAAALWIVGAGAWLAFLGPRLLGRAPRAAPMPAHALGPVAAYLVADHERLDALLARTVRHPDALDPVAYDRFRRGLLRHIGMEEKILLPAAQRRRGGEPLPEAARLRSDHGALAALLVPRPTPAIIAAIRHVIAAHNVLEEEPRGVYAVCEALVGDAGEALAAALRDAPEVPVHAPVDDVRVLDATRRALARAGYDPALV